MSPVVEPAPSSSTSSAALLAEARGLEAALDTDPAGARARATRVVEDARSRREPEPLVWALRALAVLRRHEGDPAGAVALLDEALAVAGRAGLTTATAWTLASRSVAHLELGRTARARSDASAALRIVEGHRARVASSRDALPVRDGDVPGGAEPGAGPHDREGRDPGVAGLHARVQLQLAVMDHNAGRLVEAEARYRSIARDAPASEDGVRAANNLALVLVARAEYAAARRWAEVAVDGAARLGPSLRSWPYLTRALIEVQTGRLAHGLRDLERAALASQQAGQSPGEYYVEYAETMRELRLLPEAVDAGRKAVAALVAAGNELVEVDARISLAESLLLHGDAAGAAEQALAARTRARAQRRPGAHDRAVLVAVRARARDGAAGTADLVAVRRAASRLQLTRELGPASDAHLEGGRLAAALAMPRPARRHLAAAAVLARRGPLSLRLRGRLAAALAASLAGADDEVLRECRAGLRDLARHREALPTMELRALASGHGAELGELGLEVLLRAPTPAGVLRWMEQTRAAALQAPGPVAPVPADRLEPHERGVATDAPAVPAVARRSVIVADDERAAAERRSAWLEDVGAGARTATRAPGLGAVREGLAGRTLVEYGRSGDRMVAVVVDGPRARVVELGAVVPEVEATLRALVFALRRMVDPRSAAAVDAARVSADLRLRRLRAFLVEPLGLRPDAELVVVPVGLLHGAPWSALHDGPVAMAPSAASWLRTVRRSQPAADGRVVLVAGPGLQGAQDEVEALRHLHARVQVLGAGASRADVVVDAMAGADLAHLACHGALRSDNPMFSSVELADGPVTVQELHRAGVAPRRLVLASCHSGADLAYDGDEVLGLVSAMLSRGTSGVVASIAAVPDVEVVDLMLALHRRLAAGQTMARALHGARGEIDRDAPAGFVNWCTFSAHGAA